MKTSMGLCSALAAVWLVASAAAQPAQPAISIKVLLKTTLTGDDNKEVVMASAEFPVGGTTGLHTHPGDEYATVIEGSVEILIDGQPPKQVKAGQSYHNARGLVHETINSGSGIARIVSTFVVDKGQPVMQPLNSPARE